MLIKFRIYFFLLLVFGTPIFAADCAFSVQSDCLKELLHNDRANIHVLFKENTSETNRLKDLLLNVVKDVLKLGFAIIEVLKDSESSEKIPNKDVLIDPRDGHVYKTIKIGNQIWMAENLKYKAKDSYCKDNSEDNCLKYGRQYYFYENLCPSGWKVPSVEDWNTLFSFVGAKKRCECDMEYCDENPNICEYLVWGNAGKKLNQLGFNANAYFGSPYATTGRSVCHDEFCFFEDDKGEFSATDYCCNGDCPRYIRCVKK